VSRDRLFFTLMTVIFVAACAVAAWALSSGNSIAWTLSAPLALAFGVHLWAAGLRHWSDRDQALAAVGVIVLGVWVIVQWGNALLVLPWLALSGVGAGMFLRLFEVDSTSGRISRRR
jgi:hypothetical protein